MALLTHSNVGTNTTVSGVVNVFRDITVVPDPAFTTNFISQILACDQLPHLSFYIASPAAVINPAVSILPQYAIRVQDGGAAQQFMNLPGAIMPATNDLLLNYRVPANYIRMQFFVGPDPAAVAIRLFIVCQASST